jgi:4-alpha-glucanotransferase
MLDSSLTMSDVRKPGPPRPDLLDRRRAGVLLHPTSLPGPFDGGVLGADADRFVDFLEASGFSMWQVLPLGPVDTTLSPYGVRSAFAGNPRLIDLELPEEAEWRPSSDEIAAAHEWTPRRELIARTFERFVRTAPATERRELLSFRETHPWIHPFAVFEALREHFDGEPWWHWPEDLRRRDPDAIARARLEHCGRIDQLIFEQFLFERQWLRLKRRANDKGIYVFGDLPIYVDRDSVEVWWRPELFRLDEAGRPLAVAGVPPDYFSRNGQLWGNPVYDWDRMREDGYRWWIDRIGHQLERFDLLRIDHFRALESYWEVPAGSETARNGRWCPGPGDELLRTLDEKVGVGPLVAEDLGLITEEVRALRDRYRLPGMLVLQFAFDGSPDNPFLPENHVENAVVYTGTHDNDTTLGWYRSLDPPTRRRVEERLPIASEGMPGAVIGEALRSPARLAILPMQDLLELGSEHRMNTPGTKKDNWKWRFHWEDVDPGLPGQCLARMVATGRGTG